MSRYNNRNKFRNSEVTNKAELTPAQAWKDYQSGKTLENHITSSFTSPSKVIALPKAPIDPAIQRAIMQQVVDYKVAPVDEYVKPATYVVASNGTFVVKKTQFGKITVKVKEVPYLPEMQIGFQLELPKVPYRLFLEAYSFFKFVTLDTHDEAALVLYWNTETEEYEHLCPEQTVSGAAVKFGEDKDYLLRMIDAKYIRVCELHSHNTMSAFHSGTDDNDEIFDCSFLVFGKLDTATPEHLFSYAASGVRVDSSIWDLFEKPISYTDLGGIVIEKPLETPIFVDVEYPEAWIDQLSKYTYVATTYYKAPGVAGGIEYDEDDEAAWLQGYGYNNYGNWDKEKAGKETLADLIGEDVASVTDFENMTEDEIAVEMAQRVTDKGMLFDPENIDELNPTMSPQEVIEQLEHIFGQTFLHEISDTMMDNGYGTDWREDTIRH